MTTRIDILWGWEEIANSIGVSIDTAKALARDEGLPFVRRRGKTVQSSRAALQEWAHGRS